MPEMESSQAGMSVLGPEELGILGGAGFFSFHTQTCESSGDKFNPPALLI